MMRGPRLGRRMTKARYTTEGVVPRKVPTAKRRVKSQNGREWEAVICMPSGTDPQAPNLMVVFRDPVRAAPDRYTLLPAGSPKRPKDASKQITDDELRALLKRSVPVKRM